MNRTQYLMALKSIRDSVPEKDRSSFDLNFSVSQKSDTGALILSLFLGWLGIDRFYIGSIGLGILKLLTAGLFGLLIIIDWFLIMGATRARNIAIATETKMLLSGPGQATPFEAAR